MQRTILQTPPERFNDLPDYPFSENWIDDLPGYEGIRIHYLDEGPSTAHCFLCLHGEPSWSFLYRKMIKVFVKAGNRVVCPDLIGFGKSDKVKEDEIYTPDFHREMLIRFVSKLGLSGVTLVCQDWGGLLGLTLPLALPNLVSRAIVMNTTFGTGNFSSEGFLQWKTFCESQPDMDVGALFNKVCTSLTSEEIRAYNAPFPSIEYKAGVRRFPQLVPLRPDEPFAILSKGALKWWQQFDGPVFVALGVLDFVFGEEIMNSTKSVFKRTNPVLLKVEEGHFVQEKGDIVAEAALNFFSSPKL